MNNLKTNTERTWTFLLALSIVLCSCKSTAPQYDYRKLARASIRLGVDIGMKDNHQLYIEAAEWIEQDEDVLSYALFDKVAVKFFENRRNKKYGIDGDHADIENKVHPV